MSIESKLITIANKTPEVYKRVYADRSVTGSTVSVGNVSPIPHDLRVKVESKNLIPYPYADTTKTHNGITYTDNGDGTITANGTATAISEFHLCKTNPYHSDFNIGAICISGCAKGGSADTYYINCIQTGHKDVGNGVFIGNMYTKWFKFRIYVNKGVTLNNVVFKPQVELGSTATPYTPYTAELGGVEVSRLGKNLLDINKCMYWANGYGFTTEFLEDNVIRVYGTASATMNSAAWNFLQTSQTDISGKGYVITPFAISGMENLKQIYGLRTVNEQLIAIQLNSMVAGTYYDMRFKLMVSVGTPTEYEPYIEPETATANSEGVVEGLASLCPSMTLITDNVGVTIGCDYKATTAPIETYLKLQNALVNAKQIIKDLENEMI